MISHRTPSRTAISVGVVLLAIGMFAGCTPKSEPTPTPTAAFASEEEAFAAAEEVYRAYNEASDRSDPDTDVFLTDAALEQYLEGAQYLKLNGLTLGGQTNIVSFAGTDVTGDGAVMRVEAVACIDLSHSTVVNASGVDVTPKDRAAGWRFTLTFVGDEEELLIATSSGEEDPNCVSA